MSFGRNDQYFIMRFYNIVMMTINQALLTLIFLFLKQPYKAGLLLFPFYSWES